MNFVFQGHVSTPSSISCQLCYAESSDIFVEMLGSGRSIEGVDLINGKWKSIGENGDSERSRQERRFRVRHLSSDTLVAKKEGIIKLN